MSWQEDGTRVLELIEINNIVIVLFDPKYPKKAFGPFANIEAFDKQGNKLWTIDLPDYRERFYRMKMEGELLRVNSYGYICLIEPLTGKIVSKTYVK